jgi:hypothetical protein
MNQWKEWKKADEPFARDYSARMEELTPEPLFESFLLPDAKVCLRCGQQPATSLLYSALGMKPVLPLCSSCAADWNFAGYHILKGLDAKKLLWRLTAFKLKHPFGRPSVVDIYRDVNNLLRWVKKMKRLRQSAE